MKTIVFALLNISSFFFAVIALEFMTEPPILLMVVAIATFVLSGVLSIFQKPVWDRAHKSGQQSSAFLLKSHKLFTTLITTFIVSMSILSDFVPVDRNFVVFISYVTVYLALFLPCHLVIMDRHTEEEPV